MKNDFLPKAINGNMGVRTCASIGVGRMSTEPHYHDCVEMVYVSHGEVESFFDDGWHTVRAGQLLFMPPSVIHRFISRDDGAVQTVIGFKDELVCSPEADEELLSRPYLTDAIPTGYTVSREACPKIHELIMSLSSGDRLREMSAFELDSTVLLIYGQIYEKWKREGLVRTVPKRSRYAEEISRYVAENFSRKISARELISKMNISYSYFSKILSREFGMSFGDLVISRRINEAKALLLSSEKTVAEIAYECGFPSSSAFICNFRSRTGKTPGAFRETALG